MRSFKFLSILGFVLLACMSLLFVGCGSDDDTTAPTSINGSLTDPEFVAVQEQIESLVDSTLGFALTGLNTLGSISAGGNVDPILYGPGFDDSNQITISYTNGWHIANLVQSTSSFSFSIMDSVRFYAQGDISQTGINADSLLYRHHWSFDVSDKTVSYTTLNGSAGFDFRGLNTNQLTIDGSNDLSVQNQFVSADSTVVRQFDLETDVTNLSINITPTGWDQACPNSGTISAVASMSYVKDDAAAVSSEWNITMTFTDGSAAVTVSNGNVVWRYTTDVCIAIT